MSVKTLRDVPLLQDTNNGLCEVVDDEPGGQKHLKNRECNRQVLHDLGLHRRHRSTGGARGNHLLLHQEREGQQHNHEGIRDAFHKVFAHHFGRRLGKVKTKCEHLFRLVER